MDKYNVQYWDKAKVGSIIQLDDTQTLEYLMEQGKKVSEHGADFEVVRIKKLSLNDDSIKIKIIYIQLEDMVWYLIVKTLGDEAIVKVYYEPDDFECGNREDLLQNDCFYLFEEPEDAENYLAEDLVFAKEIALDGDDFKSEMGVMYGSSFEDGDEDFATVVELSTKADNENPDSMIIELSNVDVQEQLDEDGYEEDDPIVDIESSNSYIMFLRGCSVELNDVEILN